MEPLNRYSNIRDPREPLGLGPAFAFARALYPAPGSGQVAEPPMTPIGLVVNARSGGSLKSWLPESDPDYQASDDEDGVRTSRYADTLSRIQDALNEGVGHQLKGVIVSPERMIWATILPTTATCWVNW